MKKEALKSVAIQGGLGAFHEIASRSYFDEKIKILSCETFQEIIDRLSSSEADFGLMAIENTVGGSLVSNYRLMMDSEVSIIGEEYLRIKQNLLALGNQGIEDIQEVHSHYMAIAQCRVFLNQFPHLKLVESKDTALSAAEIKQGNIQGRAAIASELAADLYDLNIVESGIETNKRNYTRFLVLAKKENSKCNVEECTKASICFSLPHKKGSLSQVLSVLAFYELDLTKIESLPIIGKEFQYFFYLDLTFEEYEKYTNSINAIRPLIQDLQILGEYKYGIESLNKIHNQ
tara:strand:- start:1056 stop:1922 length:867 start_codon:yes stop_codon:yes gene_type:complete